MLNFRRKLKNHPKKTIPNFLSSPLPSPSPQKKKKVFTLPRKKIETRTITISQPTQVNLYRFHEIHRVEFRHEWVNSMISGHHTHDPSHVLNNRSPSCKFCSTYPSLIFYTLSLSLSPREGRIYFGRRTLNLPISQRISGIATPPYLPPPCPPPWAGFKPH